MTVAAVCLFVGSAVASSPNLPAVFARQIAAVKRIPRMPPILLPSTITLRVSHYEPSVVLPPMSAPHQFDLELGAVKNCNSSPACLFASFSGSTSRIPVTPGGTSVVVKGASKAIYNPVRCGASCGPATLDFVVGGVYYEFALSASGWSGNAEPILIAAADAAIAAGPR